MMLSQSQKLFPFLQSSSLAGLQGLLEEFQPQPSVQSETEFVPTSVINNKFIQTHQLTTCDS